MAAISTITLQKINLEIEEAWANGSDDPKVLKAYEELRRRQGLPTL